MQLSTFLVAASGLASLAYAANTVHFVNQDETDRTIWFTAQSGYTTPDNLQVAGLSTANQTFDEGWIGNFYSVSAGKANTTGMLGELRFDGYNGMTFYDVSAIVNPDDWSGVKEIFPLDTGLPISGCQTFPCDNAYNAPDDVQTQASSSSALVCLLGDLSSSDSRKKRTTKFTRSFSTLL